MLDLLLYSLSTTKLTYIFLHLCFIFSLYSLYLPPFSNSSYNFQNSLQILLPPESCVRFSCSWDKYWEQVFLLECGPWTSLPGRKVGREGGEAKMATLMNRLFLWPIETPRSQEFLRCCRENALEFFHLGRGSYVIYTLNHACCWVKAAGRWGGD